MSEDDKSNDSTSKNYPVCPLDIKYLLSADAIEEDYIASQQILFDKMEETNNEIVDTQKDINPLENLHLTEIPRFNPSSFEICTSPIVSPNHPPQNLPEHTIEISSNSEVSTGNMPNVVLRDIAETHDYCANSSQIVNESTESKKHLHNPQSSETSIKTQTKQVFTKKTARKRFNTVCQGTIKNVRPSSEVKTTVELMDSSDDSKGKTAENPRFRYKKRSKSSSFSCEYLSEATPVKQSKEEFVNRDIPEQKFIKSTPPIGKLTGISPVTISKGSNSCKDDDDKQQLQGTCERAQSFSNLTGNDANEDALKLSKELKFENDKKPIEQSLNLVPYLSQTSYGFSEFIDEPQVDVGKNFNENEQPVFPYSSSITDVPSENISPTEKMDYTPITPVLSPESASDETVLSERIKSSLAIESEDVPLSERESSLLEADRVLPSSGEEKLSHTTVEENKSLETNEEPTKKSTV